MSTEDELLARVAELEACRGGEGTMNRPERYLGDGVYARMEHGMIILETKNGYRATNTVCIEPSVFENLLDWVRDEDGSEP